MESQKILKIDPEVRPTSDSRQSIICWQDYRIQQSRAQACTRIVNSTAVCPREGQVIIITHFSRLTSMVHAKMACF